MKRLLTAFVLALVASVAAAQPAPAPAAAPAAATLDELLNQVRNARAEAQQRNKQREADFIRQRDQQRALVNQSRAELATEETTSTRLQQQFEGNERELTELNTQLQARLGNLGEVFGVVRQVAADTKGVVDNSIVSSQFQGRGELAAKLAQSKALPSIDELRGLWLTLQEEMTETGKVARFKATVVTIDGAQTQADVVRVGAFNAVYEDKFLRYQPETGSLVELTRQPADRYLSQAEDLYEAAPGEMIEFGLDPTRGQLLALLVEAPDFLERTAQGGLVGNLILVLIFIALLVALERLIALIGINKRIKEQLEHVGKPNLDNALGRILSVYQNNKNDSVEVLELKLDEAIMKEVPEFEKRLPFIKLAAAVGPLMGLLGTVTGMIATFQVITLFGSGDPKLMADGIAQALVTTVEGLACAIPMVLIHGFLSTRSKEIIQLLEEQTAGIIAAHAERMGAK